MLSEEEETGGVEFAEDNGRIIWYFYMGSLDFNHKIYFLDSILF